MPVTIDGTTGITSPAIDLTTPLVVADGGTGTNTLTANNVILGHGTSAVAFVAPGSNGNVLTSDGTNWTSAAPATSVTSLNGQTGAITNTDYGAIGSYVVAANIGQSINTLQSAGTTILGSDLFFTANYTNTIGTTLGGFGPSDLSLANANRVSAGLSGTWRALSNNQKGSSNTSRPVNLFVRIS